MPITLTVHVRRASLAVLFAVCATVLPGTAAHAADRSVYGYGDAVVVGSTGVEKLNHPVVAMAQTASGDGYWLVSAEGRVYAFGAAEHHGSLAVPGSRPIIAIVPARSGDGYWLVAADGAVYTFGTAPYLGGLGDVPLSQPIVGAAATPSGRGYWLVASDGGVFTFGDAAFFGSTGALHLNQPITGMAPAPGGDGYWLVARDGGIFTFGTAAFHGSTGALRLVRSIVGMAPTPSGNGYWLVAADGGVFTFGDATYLGSLGGEGLTEPAVAIVPSRTGRGYWIATTGHLASSSSANPPQVRIGEGTHQVSALGPVFPGTYRVERAVAGCSWQRRVGDDPVANRGSDFREVVTIRATDTTFETSGCAPWVNELFPITASRTAPFGDGSWIVDVDIASGTWAAPGGPTCTWERVGDFSGDATSVLARGDGEEPVVEIQPGDDGFVTSGCGRWTRG